jgi:hypothetical protein
MEESAKPKLDMDTIAKVLGAERRGDVRAASGHFGAMQVVAEIQSRFPLPSFAETMKKPRKQQPPPRSMNWPARRLFKHGAIILSPKL